MDEVIKRVNELIRELGLTPNAFAKEVGLGSSNLSRKLKGTTPFTNKDFAKISGALDISREWLEHGIGDRKKPYHDFVDHDLVKNLVDKAVCAAAHGKEAKPFYDVDFTLGFTEMYNDEPNVPSKYISVPGYEKADFWCRTSGDSMKPFISNGDIIALKEVQDWQSFLPMNEVYAVMTTNDLRTVKVVRKGSDDEHFTLHAYNEEYEDQEIHKAAITKVFKVLGALKTM